MPNVPHELIQMCFSGDTTAWQQMMKQYGALVASAVRNALSRVRSSLDQNEVEEVCQGVWVALCDDNFRRLRGFEAKCSFSTWLTVLSSRRTLDHLRTERRKGSLKNKSLDGEGGNLLADLKVDADAIAADDRNLVFEALEQIPEEDRLVLKLYYLDELSYRAVGKVLGVTANTVSSYLDRARERVRQVMAARETRDKNPTEAPARRQTDEGEV